MDEAEHTAADIWAIARDQEQCVRRVESDEVAARIRDEIRRLAARDRIKVRTARLADTVVVVRLDARVWRQDAVTMRTKLSADE